MKAQIRVHFSCGRYIVQASPAAGLQKFPRENDERFVSVVRAEREVLRDLAQLRWSGPKARREDLEEHDDMGRARLVDVQSVRHAAALQASFERAFEFQTLVCSELVTVAHDAADVDFSGGLLRRHSAQQPLVAPFLQRRGQDAASFPQQASKTLSMFVGLRQIERVRDCRRCLGGNVGGHRDGLQHLREELKHRRRSLCRVDELLQICALDAPAVVEQFRRRWRLLRRVGRAISFSA